MNWLQVVATALAGAVGGFSGAWLYTWITRKKTP